MRRNKKGGAQISKHNHQAMHFQIARFCNAKFGFKGLADSSSSFYFCRWMRASARPALRTRMDGALRVAGV